MDAAAKEEEEEENGDVEEGSTVDPKRHSTVIRLDNVSLRGVKPAVTFDQLEAEWASDLAFKDFRVRLQNWITTNAVWDPEGTRGQRFRFDPTDKVKSIEISVPHFANEAI